MSSSLREALASRVVVADGAMGTMLQAEDPSLEDFQGLEGCNEILNITRADIVRGVHDAYFEVGVDAVETNTFGANWANLAEYDIPDRIRELAAAGARIARESADAFSTPTAPRWVLGSVGPGTKLPTLGHVDFETLRAAYAEQVVGLLDGGSDAVLIETSQDLLQTKSAVIGAQDGMATFGLDVPLIVHVTVETTGTMLLGSEIGAALTSLQALGIDLIGLNCATGPAEMSEHLRVLAQQATIGLSCMPNAGLPVLTSDGAHYPLTPAELADALEVFVQDYGLSLVGGCCGTTPEHLRLVADRVRGMAVPIRTPQPEPGISSLYQPVPFDQDSSFLSIGERTNANGSKAFREAMLAQNWDDCVQIARNQQRDGAHVLDLCIDYVGRNGVDDMTQLPAAEQVSAISAPAGLNLAVAHGEAWARAHDHLRIAVIAADLPCLTADDVRTVLAGAALIPRGFVIDEGRSGTTMLTTTGPSLLPTFGEHSARRHLATGAEPLPATAAARLDVDQLDALLRARDLGVGAATAAVLSRHGIEPHSAAGSGNDPAQQRAAPRD